MNNVVCVILFLCAQQD